WSPLKPAPSVFFPWVRDFLPKPCTLFFTPYSIISLLLFLSLSPFVFHISVFFLPLNSLLSLSLSLSLHLTHTHTPTHTHTHIHTRHVDVHMHSPTTTSQTHTHTHIKHIQTKKISL